MSEKRIAVYAGSFDPITLGHQNMIEKAVRLFDELHIVIAINSSKKSTFSVKERDVFILDVIKDLHDVADVGSIEIHAVKSQYVVRK